MNKPFAVAVVAVLSAIQLLSCTEPPSPPAQGPSAGAFEEGAGRSPPGAGAFEEGAGRSPHGAGALEEGFAHPPAAAGPHTWWHWMNGMVTAEGITADLEAMKRAGLGGAQIFNVDQHTPPGPAPFMGPEWRELVRHAVREAHRLGLELCIHNCAGWSSSGGPWVKPEQAMQVVVHSETHLTGPASFAGDLPRPGARLGFYRDIAVLALPTPGGAPEKDTLRIEDLPGKAAFERRNDLKPAAPGVAGGKAGAAAAAPGGEGPPGIADLAVKKERILDLTDRLGPDGTFRWEVPAGSWTIIRIGHTPTGAVNAPAPAAGRGPEVDKMSREAMDAFFAGMMKTVIDDNAPFVGGTLRGALIDSYEVGSQNWTPGFRAAFAKKRGYDPLPWLATLTGRVVDSVERSERFLWDFRRTIAEMFRDDYFAYFAKLCRGHGMLASVEPYGNGLFDDLEAGAAFDIPMGEFWVGGGAMGTLKIAASIAHTNGRRIAGAESFTARPEAGRWQLDPWALKAIGDRAFCMGVNRLVLHCYAMQPWLDKAPGMTMGPWGTCFGRNNTWWHRAGAWTAYLARCQFLLRQGRFVGDVCCYVGEDSPAGLRAVDPPLPEGYDYDGLSRSQLLGDLEVRGDGRLVLPCGMTYRVLVLPDTDTMTVAVARKIRALVKEGATVVGPRPVRSPSLAEAGEGDETVRRIAAEVWENLDGKTVKRRSFGKGRIYWGLPLGKVLEEAGAAPDFLCGDARKGEILYIHRTVPAGGSIAGETVRGGAGGESVPGAPSAPGGGAGGESVAPGAAPRGSGAAEIYFVSNQADVTRSVTCSFRVSGLKPELWHPDTGVIEEAALYRGEKEKGGSATAGRDPLSRPGHGGGAGGEHGRDPGRTPRRSLHGAPGRTVVPLLLDPRGSVFVVFREPAGAAPHLTALLRGGRSALAPEQAAAGPRVEIERATYGILDDPKRCVDVTAEVAAGVAGGAAAVRASNSLAGDPAVNVVKEMRVDFTVDGEKRSVTVREGQSVAFPGGGMVLRPAAVPVAGPGGSISLLAWKGGRYEARTGGRYELEQAGRPGAEGVGPMGEAEAGRRVDAAPIAVDVPDPGPPLALDGPWEVTFSPGRGAPERVTLDRLASWTKNLDKGVRYFSGTATYRKTFTVPRGFLRPGGRVFLDLGRVKKLAAVRLNGGGLAVLWKPPFSVDVTGLLEEGENTLVVEVTNLWPNRLIGDEQEPDDCEWDGNHLAEWPSWLLEGKPRPSRGRVAFTVWKHWNKDDALLESGLIGPVLLRRAVLAPLPVP